MSHNRTEQGFSLVELLVAAGMTGIVSLATVGFLLTQRTFQRSTELQLEARQGLQATMDMLARDIRLAGLCLDKTGVFSSLTAADTGTRDAITLRIGKVSANLQCIDTTLAGAVDEVVAPEGESDLPVASVAGFSAGDYAYITGTLGSGEFAKISSVDSGSSLLTLESGVSRDYSTGTRVRALTERAYSVTGGGGTTRPTLMVSVDGAAAEPVAVGITALDIQYELRTGCPSCQVVAQPTTDEQRNRVRSISLSVTARAARAAGSGESIHEESASLDVKPRNYTTVD